MPELKLSEPESIGGLAIATTPTSEKIDATIVAYPHFSPRNIFAKIETNKGCKL